MRVPLIPRRRRVRYRIAAALLTIGCATTGWMAGPDSAAAAGRVGWTISAVAEPTNFSSRDTFSTPGHERCIEEGGTEPKEHGGVCDRYVLTIANVGSKPLAGPITIKDVLPSPTLKVANVEGRNLETEGEEQVTGNGFECSAAAVACKYANTMAPGDVLQVKVRVFVGEGAPTETVENHAIVETEGVVVASTAGPGTVPNTINGTEPEFGVQDSILQAYGVDGTLDTLAGDHPFDLTSGFDLNSKLSPASPASEQPFEPIEQIKDVVVDLPLGMVADPEAASQCSEASVVGRGGATTCPSTSRVGNLIVNFAGQRYTSLPGGPGAASALYNVTPESGYPAQFAADVANQPISLYGQVVPTADGYRLRVLDPGIPRLRGIPPVDGVVLTLFGDPGEHNAGGAPDAFLTNPFACGDSPLRTSIYVDSWTKPGKWTEGGKILSGPNGPGSSPLLSDPAWRGMESVAYPGIVGCNALQFDPGVSVQPSTTQADEPVGYTMDVKVPQAPNVWPDRATPDLRDATVTLPAGTSISPTAAEGLEGCTEAQLAPMSSGPADCPAKSQIGTVEVKTPLLEEPFKGHVYVAQPKCAGNACEQAAEEGNVFGLYLEMAGSGVIVKQAGTIEVGGYGGHNGLALGQLRAKFDKNPQFPFEDLKMVFSGGQRSALANPQTCGTATATSELEPWSAPESGPNATPSSSFGVTGCANPLPFAPGFSAGTVQTLADAFTPFTMTLSRKDGEQNLGGVSLTMPPGVAGMLSKVPLCGEPQAQEGKCSEASRIGTVNAAAGAGSEPLWLPGRVYLTGPYNGAPFGLSIVVPAVAGPFNLGNVVERATINVDPHTAQVTVTDGPLQQSRDGVPFRLKALNVTIDREGFMFNPTNCSQLHVTGTVSGVMPSTGAPGSSVAVSTPFAVAGCKNLPFKPKFQVSTSAKHSRKNGASLHVVVQSGAGQANIGSVKVNLPKQLPSRLDTLKLACPEATFAANPAACPAGSKVGGAKAYTPVLPVPMSGPAYFVSHGGAAFPDLVVVLQGDGVTVELVGNTFISKAGITSSTFATVPDVPITRFDLTLPVGAHSALTANGNLCKGKLLMPTTIKGQNGAVVKQSTKIAVTGCAKAKKKVKKKVKKGKKK